MNDIVVGSVISIEGTHIEALLHENTNVLNYYVSGTYYNGITVGAYVGIIRGPYKIIGKIIREYLIDKGSNTNDQSFGIDRFERKVHIKIVGTFMNEDFVLGIKSFPMVYNEVVLLNTNELLRLIQPKKSLYPLNIGETLEGVAALIDSTRLFNSHIGVFGNTGSGKSNTLTKLYTSLFDLNFNFEDISTFIFIDFNGEYLGHEVLTKEKNIIKLSTRKKGGQDKIAFNREEFWDVETLSILFSATEKTQQPFLNAALNHYLDKNTLDFDSGQIIAGIGSAFFNTFKFNNNKETLSILIKVYKNVTKKENADFKWSEALWHSSANTFYFPSPNFYFNSLTERDIIRERDNLQKELHNHKDSIDKLSPMDKLLVMVNLRLIYGLCYGHVQYDHINPLIQRIESRSISIEKLVKVNDDVFSSGIHVISLRDCNIEAKKIIPLLLAKKMYSSHKKKTVNDETITQTFNLIIDEAHNILSADSTREESSWKDYRLEVFEEIIKEGRKFGFYITLCSQRPSDISPTIMSQLHNYFLHRLVNENDIRMISNTLNSLDNVSKETLPSLAPGQCIVTGTSFEIPLLIQVKLLEKNKQPKSENANLELIWKKK